MLLPVPEFEKGLTPRNVTHNARYFSHVGESGLKGTVFCSTYDSGRIYNSIHTLLSVHGLLREFMT